MSSQAKQNTVLLALFGEESLVDKFQNLRDPKEKIGMIWKTSFFQVKYTDVQDGKSENSWNVVDVSEREFRSADD